MKLTTDSLDYDRKKQSMMTDDIVNIERDNMTTTAKGAKGEMNMKKVSLEKDVRLDINPKETPKQGDPVTEKIVITCDGPLEVDYQKNIAYFNNNVKVERDQATIYSDIMHVYFNMGGSKDNAAEPQNNEKEKPGSDPAALMGGSINKIVAKGNVKIVRGQNVSYSRVLYFIQPRGWIRMHLLEVKGLSKSYDGKQVVKGVDLLVKRGEIVGLLGPNGAGKTTTFYMIVGIIPPNSGKIVFDNNDITNLPIHERARFGIGYLSQEASIFRKLTVEENIMAILETLPINRAERLRRLKNLLEELNIAHLASHKAFTLSGGERRRLEITRALVTNPSFILLDEPFSGIDPIVVNEAQEIIKELKEKGLGILLTDHNVRETLSITDRAYLIAEGRILISGSAQELINDPQARQIYLGENFSM
jgi:lipopolysaccharide export system ATP-binding protein